MSQDVESNSGMGPSDTRARSGLPWTLLVSSMASSAESNWVGNSWDYPETPAPQCRMLKTPAIVATPHKPKRHFIPCTM